MGSFLDARRVYPQSHLVKSLSPFNPQKMGVWANKFQDIFVKFSKQRCCIRFFLGNFEVAVFADLPSSPAGCAQILGAPDHRERKKDGCSDAVDHPILLSIRVGLYLVGFSLSVASLKAFFICTQDSYVLPTGKNPFSRSPDASIRQHYHRGRKKGGHSEAASHPVLSLLRLERPFSFSHVFVS